MTVLKVSFVIVHWCPSPQFGLLFCAAQHAGILPVSDPNRMKQKNLYHDHLNTFAILITTIS